MYSAVTPVIVKAKKMKKALPIRIAFRREVIRNDYWEVSREDLPDYLGPNDDEIALFKDKEAEEKEWYDRAWKNLCDRAVGGEIELEAETDCDGEELDGRDDCEIDDIFNEVGNEVEAEFKAKREEEAKKKAEEEASVVVPVAPPQPPEKTREELIAEIDRLTAELDAIKARMRKAMEDLGY